MKLHQVLRHEWLHKWNEPQTPYQVYRFLMHAPPVYSVFRLNDSLRVDHVVLIDVLIDEYSHRTKGVTVDVLRDKSGGLVTPVQLIKEMK